MFATAYYRKFIKDWQAVSSPNYSVVLKAVPSGKLMYIEDIVKLVLNDKENDTVKSGREVESVLKSLITDGFVGEAHGLKIEKFIKTL